MPLPADPPRSPGSPFASMRGHHTGIRYPRFEDALSFWVDKLDWRVLQIWPYGGLTLAYVMPPDQDDFHLEILAGPGAVPQPQFTDVGESLLMSGLNHVCLSVSDVDATVAELRARGVEVVGEPFELDDISARLAFFRDPWGNFFEISQRLD
ncbi:VOC family protein [Dactylosporangium sp. CS-033363]|uniref:VOC family protein n=1 Tax=Dactylosporangium sp. CS-033363 TaxID=3239935 RepID=UPI003D8A1FEB